MGANTELEGVAFDGNSQGGSFLTYLLSIAQQMIGVDIACSSSVYHYTTLEAFAGGILPQNSDEDIFLWATHCGYLNDPKEMQIDIDKIKEDVENISSLRDLLDMFKDKSNGINSFLLSFTTNQDYLPMWSMYGKNGNGIVLEFDPDEFRGSDLFLRCIYPDSLEYKKLIQFLGVVLSDDPTYRKSKFYVLLDQAQYPESTLHDSIVRLRRNNQDGECDCEAIFSHFFTSLRLIFLPLVTHKNAAYQYEKEVRMVLSPDDSRVKFRVSNNMLIPYIEKRISREALKSITLGPTQDFERSKKSLEMLLADRGFSQVNIFPSSVPYRH